MKQSWNLQGQRDERHSISGWFTRVLITGLIVLAGSSLASAGLLPGRALVHEAQAALLADVAAAAPLISYQGRLVDPTTGLPKPDGAYPMSFRLYTVPTGGSPLYTEARTVDVIRSVFSILLGEVTPLDPNIFNGQELYLGATVGGDPEMAPRLRLAHAPYAIYADRAGVANSSNTANTANAANTAAVASSVVDNAINSAKVADGSLALVDLSPAAQSPRFIDLPVYSALLTGAAALNTGFGPNAGIVLQEAATSGAFSLSFTVPPNFTTGGTLNGRIVYTAPATGCQLFLAPNFISVGRVGRNHIVGTGASTGLNMASSLWAVGATSSQSSAIPFSVTSPVAAVPLQALDTIIIGFYRSSAAASGDTCTVGMTIQSVSLTY